MRDEIKSAINSGNFSPQILHLPCNKVKMNVYNIIIFSDTLFMNVKFGLSCYGKKVD